MRPERADLRPERADLKPGRGDEWTDGWTNKSPVFYRTFSWYNKRLLSCRGQVGWVGNMIFDSSTRVLWTNE